MTNTENTPRYRGGSKKAYAARLAATNTENAHQTAMTTEQLLHLIELFNNNSHDWMQRADTNASSQTDDPMSAAECYGRGATWAQAASTLEALLD